MTKPKTTADDEIVLKKSDVLAMRLGLALAPLVHAKRLHPASLAELTHRALDSGMFDLSKDGLEMREHLPACEWLDDTLSRAPHLARTFSYEPKRDEQKGGLSEAALAKMTPRAKLDWANREAFKRVKIQ